MASINAGMTSVAVGFPSIVRTNDYYRRVCPEIVAKAEEHGLAKLWAKGQQPHPFDSAATAYAADPFRGTLERRLRAKNETSLSMELRAARGALEAAGLTTSDIDLTLVSSFPPDQVGPGNALYLAKEMGIKTPAWNFETACSGSVVGVHQAASLVRSGDYRRVLVVVSTSNSTCAEDQDSLGWFVGDGAGAFIVERLPDQTHGVLGWHTINGVETADMFTIHSVPTPDGGTRLRTSASSWANRCARETSAPYLRACVDGALSKAQMAIPDVDFWVFNTPNAWYADFCAEVLGVEQGRYHSVYRHYSNIGSALMPTTLYHALHERKIDPGDVVGLYSVGSTATSAAVIMRVGEIALGPYPERPAEVDGPGDP